MEQRSLAKWLKIVIAGIGICGILVYAAIVPLMGNYIVESFPEFQNRYMPWLIFIWATGVPCYIGLFLAWKIAANIGNDKSFSVDNARMLKTISLLAAFDSLFFFVGNIALLLADMNHPSVVLVSFLVVFVGVSFSVAAAALSHLVKKSADLQEESELTI